MVIAECDNVRVHSILPSISLLFFYSNRSSFLAKHQLINLAFDETPPLIHLDASLTASETTANTFEKTSER